MTPGYLKALRQQQSITRCGSCRKYYSACHGACPWCKLDRLQNGAAWFEFLHHGDADHQRWLSDAITAYINDESRPEPYGQGRKDAEIERLQAERDALQTERDAIERNLGHALERLSEDQSRLHECRRGYEQYRRAGSGISYAEGLARIERAVLGDEGVQDVQDVAGAPPCRARGDETSRA